MNTGHAATQQGGVVQQEDATNELAMMFVIDLGTWLLKCLPPLACTRVVYTVLATHLVDYTILCMSVSVCTESNVWLCHLQMGFSCTCLIYQCNNKACEGRYNQ
jgi:hypothetical protein